MKVLYLTNSVSRDDGWGRCTSEIVCRVNTLGIEPILGLQGHALPRSAHLDLPVRCGLRSGSIGPRLLGSVDLLRDRRQLRCVMDEVRAVHCLTEPLMPLGHQLAKHYRIPFYATLHGTYAVLAVKGRSRDRYMPAFEAARTLISVSRYTRDRIVSLAPHLAPVIQVVPLGVEDPCPHDALATASDREAAFITIGHIKPRKGLDLVVGAMARVIERAPEAILYVVGAESNRDYSRKVRALADSLRVSDRIRWLGPVEEADLVSLLRRVRGMVLPSMNVDDHFEGFGLVHLEANVNGTPSIGSLDCGNEDAVQDGCTGYLVPQGDVDMLSDRMVSLLDNDMQWNRLSGAAREFPERMTWLNTVQGYGSVYHDSGLPVSS